jgi:signal transduction histidine kinase
MPMQSTSASAKRRPFVVPRPESTPESKLAQFSNRILRLSPWLIALFFAVLVLLCNAALDWFLLRHHDSPISLVEISDVVSALIAGVLFFKVAQYHRERQRALRQRLEIISEMNHHIRNALEVISLLAHTSKDQEHVQEVRESVDRITWALKEVLPKM